MYFFAEWMVIYAHQNQGKKNVAKIDFNCLDFRAQ